MLFLPYWPRSLAQKARLWKRTASALGICAGVGVEVSLDLQVARAAHLLPEESVGEVVGAWAIMHLGLVGDSYGSGFGLIGRGIHQNGAWEGGRREESGRGQRALKQEKGRASTGSKFTWSVHREWLDSAPKGEKKVSTSGSSLGRRGGSRAWLVPPGGRPGNRLAPACKKCGSGLGLSNQAGTGGPH